MTAAPSSRSRRALWASALAACLLGAMLTAPAQAQTTGDAPVALVADRVLVEPEGRLIAEGAVEVFSGTQTLSASRITYDQAADRLSIEGPIRITDGPDTVVLAEAAELSADLRDGLIEGARLILAQRLQVTAGDMRRTEGRFTDMRGTVATTCEICRPGQIPLWQIRSRRVIHDEELERIFFENAHFRLYGVPVFWLPAMSIPEPGIERARGFLVPQTRTSDLFGTGFKLPYFIPLGDHADVTLTPYISRNLAGSSGNFTNTLEYRYRQEFVHGSISLEGAVSQDDVKPDTTRAFLYFNGAFNLPEEFKLRFNLRTVSDDNYLNDYNYSGTDRLQSNVGVSRIQDDNRIAADIIHYQSLREGDDANTLPGLLGEARYDKRWRAPQDMGFIDFTVLANGHERPSEENIEGRDGAHMRGHLRWSNEGTFGPGLRLGADARLIGDLKYIWQDDRYPQAQTALTPGLAFSARLPLSKPGKNGVGYLLEPIAELVWTGDYDIDAPNDDSTHPGFDAGNLFGFRRFPGLDRVEDGLRANLALRWQRFDPSGWRVGLTFGQVFRADNEDLFSPGTGLDGLRSNLLMQAEVDYRSTLSLSSLLLLDHDGNATLNQTRLALRFPNLRLGAAYAWQIEDPALNQTRDLSELAVDGRWNINDHWAIYGDVRRDFEAARTVYAEAGVTYRNECIRVDLSGLRRFRNTSNAEPTITYDLTVGLADFGTGANQRPIKSRCRG